MGTTLNILVNPVNSYAPALTLRYLLHFGVMTLAKGSEKHISACILVSFSFHSPNVVSKLTTHSRGLAARRLHDHQPHNQGHHYIRTQVVWSMILIEVKLLMPLCP